jgi:outer membrane protein insertion porin family
VIRAIGLAGLLFLACGCAHRRAAPDDLESWKPSFGYRFEGNAAVKNAVLIEAAKTELRAFETQGRKAADLDDAAYAMRRELRNQGYAHAKVTVRPEPSAEEIAAVTFQIEEGPKTRLGALTFPGAQVRGESELRKFFVFEEKKRGLLGPEEEPRPFRRADLDSGITHVEGLYLGDGYLRVKVGPPKITWSDDRVIADVAIPIEENRRYVVRAVTIDAKGDLPASEAVQAAVRVFEGHPYHPRAPVRTGIAVRAVLSAAGHVLAKIEPSAKVDDATATAEIKVAIQPGPKVTIAGVQVDGNRRTREGFVLDRARLEAGSVLTGERLDRASENLYGTGLFKSVRIEPIVPPGTESRPSTDSYEAQVAIAIEELMARTIDFEIGWGSYELLRSSIRYRDRNLFGIGRDFEVEPAASTKSVGIDARFFDRYIFGKKNTLEVISGALLREEPSYDLVQYRIEAAVRRRFTEQLMGRAGYRFVRSNASDVHVDDDEADRDTSTSAGPFATIEYDRRDNPILPSRGYFVGGGAALNTTFFGGNLDYVDLYAEGSVYLRLGEDLVLGLAARGQTRPILDGSETLPIQERLFLGGAHSVRSFGEDELGPTDPDGDPFGGLTALDATIELRQRLGGDLHGAVFYDIGSVGDSAFDVDGFGQAIGIGLRYYLPMGPVRLDVGYNPGRWFGADSDVAVHFSFGFSF